MRIGSSILIPLRFGFSFSSQHILKNRFIFQEVTRERSPSLASDEKGILRLVSNEEISSKYRESIPRYSSLNDLASFLRIVRACAGEFFWKILEARSVSESQIILGQKCQSSLARTSILSSSLRSFPPSSSLF